MERQDGSESGLTRERIAGTLVAALEPLEYVLAMWEGGSTGFARTDAWSDLDLQIDVEDDRVEETLQIVESSLRSLSAIEELLEIPHPPALGLFQRFYKLRDAGPYLLIDLCVIRHSGPDKFLEPEIHGEALFYFNKGGVVKIPRLRLESHLERVRERLERTRRRFSMFHAMVQKELFRENLTGAVDLYFRLIVDSLVDVLRLRHTPAHFDWKVPYIDHDLPADVVRRLEPLFFLADRDDLARKYEEASHWYASEVAAVDWTDVEARLRAVQAAVGPEE